jgi:hypothetical protein
MIYEGDGEKLERLASIALPRAEAAQFPVIAFTRSVANTRPLAITFKTGNFAVLDWSVANPTWLATASGTKLVYLSLDLFQISHAPSETCSVPREEKHGNNTSMTRAVCT